MAVELMEKSSQKISEVYLGATKDNLGSRDAVVSVGGQTAMPFLFKEGSFPNKPRIAIEIWDTAPLDWPKQLLDVYGPHVQDSLEWAEICVKKYKAQLICLRLQGAHPDFGNKTADEEAKLVSSLLKKTGVPLIISGCGDDSKDNFVLPACSDAAKGERCLIGEAVQDNYKTLTAAVLADGHNIIAQSPIDINIAKQLNILISDMGLPLDRIVINPTIGALGYGMEYAYSIMERARLAAFAGDKLMASPFICFVAQEAWRAKESRASSGEFPQWGPELERGVAWEVLTAVALLAAGADILVMRHPAAIEKVNKYIEELFVNS